MGKFIQNSYIGVDKPKKKANQAKMRNSSIELLKIIALILIVISHSVPFYGNTESIAYIELGIATKDMTVFILNLLKCCGQVGNILFALFRHDLKPKLNMYFPNFG